MNENDLWDMSDDELEAAFKEAQADVQSPEVELEASAEVAEQPTEEILESEPSMEETDEVEIDNGPEQPEEELEDSGHDTSDEVDTDDVDDEDELTEDEGDLDEDPDTEDSTSSEDTDDEDTEEQPAQRYKFKANGKDYEFSSDEIVNQFPRIFGQAMDYTKKMQNIKPWRKTIDAIEGADLSHEDVSLMIDVLKGDKEAITEVLKRTGTDTLELDTEADSNYVAKDYGRDDGALAIKDVVDDISRDTEYATTHNILSKEWDQRSWESMAQNPEMIRLLHQDVKSGMYGTIQPLAEKLKVYDGASKSDLDYYKEAAQQHFNEQAELEARQARSLERQAQVEATKQEEQKVAAVKAKSAKRTATKSASAKRKAAAPTKRAAPSPVIDYLDDSDEAFDEWYKNLQDSM